MSIAERIVFGVSLPAQRRCISPAKPLLTCHKNSLDLFSAVGCKGGVCSAPPQPSYRLVWIIGMSNNRLPR